jgi:HTH-type transcriptional regulator/antitoxin HigA
VFRLGKSEVRIEGATGVTDDPDETKADRFARDVLIPPKDAAELGRLKSTAAVRKFAVRIGIAPGIVVGRLQHDNFWTRSRGNDLKRRLALTDAADDV